ncbi:MAG TPA: di-trans,poly-cis-decaprenylcistransferase [Cyanobacteria bacterium UBA8530]|nr:di-trans,poly-cis-decaprenylcistransferase [Cyanobacteria bacterium UBA8530]
MAVIMDGNRRWAKKRLLPKNAGHIAGVESLKTLVKSCRSLEIPFLTAYAFSTENWSRSSEEVGFLWKLFAEVLSREIDGLDENQVRLRFIGNIEELSPELKAIVARGEEQTKNNDKLSLNIALNYGGRQEILQAVQKVVEAGIEKIDEKTFASFLYTNGQPDPDFLIRTSGEMRLSNYLLWQLAYTEIFVTPTLWPDFREEDFLKALLDYQGRNRRFGGRP